jgi:hypothetical protein
MSTGGMKIDPREEEELAEFMRALRMPCLLLFILLLILGYLAILTG